MSNCLSQEQLEELVAGAPRGLIAEDLQAHLGECSECRERLERCKQNQLYLNDISRFLRTWETADTKVLEAGSGAGSALEESTNPLLDLSPDMIEGYKIIREIHRGGQGVVYEAVQLATNRVVAVKVLLFGPFANDRARSRFEREVRLLAALRHPNIVAIHDSGVIHGRYYFAMDYVPGRPLDTYVQMARPALRELIQLFVQVCTGVSYAHRHGIIHRDLKPLNILIEQDGKPCILDFGLAKAVKGESPRTQQDEVTVAGNLMGTLRYMSPEQTMGNVDEIDVRTDVYTLGIILYELLTGQAPYDTNQDLAEALSNIQKVDPPKPSRFNRQVNSELDAIVMKAVEKEPDRRYQSAAELEADLTAWLEGRAVLARSASSLYMLRKIATRHGFETAVVATLLISVISFAAISIEYYLKAEEAGVKQAHSESMAAAVTGQYETAMPKMSGTFVEYTLGWFLLEWHAGRLDRARSIQRDTALAFPQYGMVMEYLLDETVTADQLRDRLPKGTEGLLYFAVGERAAKAGRIDEAIRNFELSIEHRCGHLLQASARARVEQLRDRTGTTPHSTLGEWARETRAGWSSTNLEKARQNYPYSVSLQGESP